MKRLVGPGLLLGRERRLVHEQVGVAGHFEHLERRPCITGEHDLATGARRSEHLLGSHVAPVRKVDRLPALEPPEERALRNPQRLGGLEVEAPGTRVLGQAVAVRPDAVLDGEGEDAVIAALERVAGHELAQLDVVGELPEDPAEDPEKVDQARRAVDREWQLAASERERLQHPRQAEVVVGVVVRQEDLVQLDEPDRGAEELSLSAFAAVEEDPVSAAADQRSGQAAARGGH
jgi:hypothetical protein